MIEKDKEWYKIKVNKKAYSLRAIYSAAYVFLDKFYIMVDEDKNYYLINVKGKDSGISENDALEVDNQLVNYERYFSMLKENNEVAKLIIQRSLFSASPKFLQEAEEKEIEDLIKELEADES